MADRFFTATKCDRCGGSLEGGRIMSMFNEDCICMECHRKERELPEFKQAAEAELAEIKRGNKNFKGIGFPEQKKKVTTICYNQKQEWDSREEALEHFLNCMYNSEGSEHQRYSTIYLKLKAGDFICSDDCE